jgi:hypothetical protein
MNGRILVAVLITVIIYAIYSWYSTKNSPIDSFAIDINSQNYAEAETTEPPIEASLTRVIAPSGPAPPNQASSEPAVRMPEESPFDPQEQSYESSDIPERLRHPERMFGPGLVNDQTSVATESGIATQAEIVTQNSFQQFGPEFAQNGGAFLDGGVIANDSTLPTSYSMI